MDSGSMSQNIYDKSAFFEGYSKLRRSVEGLDGAPEWLQLRSMLPDMRGLRVLDLGCGYGWFCRWAVEQGAAAVRGVDISQRMLDKARSMTDGKYPAITYQREDLDAFVLPREDEGTYDLVFSSLAFHYLANLGQMWLQVHRALKPGGQFVFSVEHPIYTAPSNPGMKEDGGSLFWRLDDYQKEGERVVNWIDEGVRKQHRTVTSYLNLLWAAGFELTGFDEGRPTAEELETHPQFYKDWLREMIKPTFLLMRAKKGI